MAINGNSYDWESIEIRLPHGVAVNIQEISYNDEADIEEHYGKGRTLRGTAGRITRPAAPLTWICKSTRS